MRARLRRSRTPWRARLAIGLAVCVLLLPAVPSAAPISNSATGSANGVALDTLNATVTLNATGDGPAVDSVTAEINPGAVITGSGTTLTVTLRPTIPSGHSGFDRVTVTLPAGYGSVVPGAVTVNGATIPAGGCPTPTGNSQCRLVSGNDLVVVFGERIAQPQSDQPVQIRFSADPPAAAGSATFLVTVDDTATVSPAQSALPGDADGVANNDRLEVAVTDGLDPFVSTLTAAPFIVPADGVAVGTLTATLFDTAGQPLAGENVTLSSDRGGLDAITQPGATSAAGVASGGIASFSPGLATITATVDGTPLNQKAQVAFTQGLVLDVSKSADRTDVGIGDVVTYRVEVRNNTTNDVVQVSLADHLPPNFVYRAGSATMDGSPIADPAGVRTLTFPIGTVAALVDGNGNGIADPGEPGYHVLTYQLIVSAGATPGTYTNSAFARDVCDSCAISNRSGADVEVGLDPLFDLGTIIGKVFEDTDGDGWQDRDEAGVAGAMVALDDGTYALTDPHGRYHFPAVKPGQRLLKINLLGLGNGAATTTGDTAVVSVTPGLLAKANFGIVYRYENARIGRPAAYGLRLEADGGNRPVDIHGSVENQVLLINGQPLALPGTDIRMRHSELDEVVNLTGGELREPIRFLAIPRNGEVPTAWRLEILDADGDRVKQFSGAGAVEALSWDGRLESGELLRGGHIYQYQLVTDYADGTRSISPRRLFGVDQTSAIAMSLTGAAFVTGATELSDAAREVLKDAAEILRRYPHEKIIIEGHTDSVGSAALNMTLSRQRAEAALRYLTEVEGLSPDRFVTRWYGEGRPMASNALVEGRELNRRVEIKGEYHRVERAQLLDQYHTRPRVAINGSSREPQPDGRFHVASGEDDRGRLEIAMVDHQGAAVETSLEVPSCRILEPLGATLLPFGLQGDTTTTAADEPGAALDDAGTIVQTRLVAATEPENTVLYRGAPVPLGADGYFSLPLALKEGTNQVDLLIRNRQNLTRLAGLTVTVATRTAAGGHIVFAEPVPYLSVRMPPTDRPLNSDVFVISGRTDGGNRVTVNGREVALQPGGHFTTVLNLEPGRNPIRIRVTDPEEHSGTIERTAEISDTRLFLLAFADSTVSHLKTSGNLDNAGVDDASRIVTEGRVALYLKGTVAGRYLLTAAFDTGTGELDDIFSDLDATETDRLLTNLDPDRHYPVYGDTSQLVYDTESQGKLYLALDSEELNLLLGNYRLNLAGGELATYQRTLYGGHAVYRSPHRTLYGDAASELEVFGAEVRQVHVRDEIDATGGSLYYLSENDIVEGSEQVTIVVRDKLTGLRLASLPQEEGLDYTIKYPEGRLLFRRPVSSVQPDQRLTDSALLAGNPVVIQVDYEARIDAFEKTAAGGRVRQHLGDHVAVGGTFVRDELENGTYEMWGVDTEVKLGVATRLLAEYATSEGAGATVNVSHDGGLTFAAVPRLGTDSGAAWKAAAEIDVGEWIRRPDRFNIGLYYKEIESGFHAAGHTAEEGTAKSGALARLRLTERDELALRFDLEERDVDQIAAIDLLRTATAQWRHRQGRWRLIGEYQLSETGLAGESDRDDQFAAIRLEYEAGTRLVAWIERQQTLAGADNDQTSFGADYRLNSAVSLHASATDGSRGQAAEGGISVNLGNSRVYLTQRLNESEAERDATTILGGERNFLASGKIYSEYQWARSRSGHRNLSIVGAERGWDLQPGLHLFVGGELSEISGPATQSQRTSLVSGISYHIGESIRLTSRNEMRRETGTTDRDQFLTINKAEAVIRDDLTLLGLYRFSETDNRTGDFREAGFEEVSLGLAWRPVDNDRFNALARLTRLIDRQPETTGGPARIETTLETAAVEWSLQINRVVEWVEKEALRWQERDDPSGTFASRSWLSIHRLNVLIGTDFDLGLEYRSLAEEASDTRREGWLSEAGWRPKKHVRFGIGYNFTDFSDDERSLNNYSVEGWFFRAQGMY